MPSHRLRALVKAQDIMGVEQVWRWMRAIGSQAPPHRHSEILPRLLMMHFKSVAELKAATPLLNATH